MTPLPQHGCGAVHSVHSQPDLFTAVNAWADEIVERADGYLSLLGIELAKADTNPNDDASGKRQRLRNLAYTVQGMRNQAADVAKWCKKRIMTDD